MVPLLISIYLIVVSVSAGLLLAAFSKKAIGLLEAFSLGLSVVLVGGLVFYERAAFEYYAFLLVFFPIALTAWMFSGRSDAISSTGPFKVYRPQFITAAIVGLSALVLVTIVTRLPVSNFLFSIGDAGSYVNSANSLARTGSSATQFFPLNQILLGLFSSLGGVDSTPYGVVFAGFLSIFYAYLFGGAFFDDKRWGIVVAFLVAFNVLAMWFARVPYSETLMLAVNLGALSFYIAARNGNAPVLNYILFGLFISLASINRVTGIVWMLLLTVVAIVIAFQDRRQFRQFVPGALLAVLGYFASVYVALRVGPEYYMGWQIKEYIPFIDSRLDLLVFHGCWLFGSLVAVALTLRFDDVLDNAWKRIGRNGALVTAMAFIIVIPLAVLLVSGGNKIMGVEFYTKLVNMRWPQDAYFLVNYFTPLSLLLFPLGLVFLFRQRNPFADPRSLAVWLFAFLFLIIYYARVVYHRPHDVYLYWDRYFLSEVFVVFVAVLTAGMVLLARTKWTRLLIPVFMGVYFVYGAVWLGENRNRSYLDGGEEIFSWLQDVVPKRNTVLYLDAAYEGRWLFSNVRQSLMVPLRNSFGYHVNLGPNQSKFFEGDTPVSWIEVDNDLARGEDVYIIRARKFDINSEIVTMEGMHVDQIAEKAFNIKIKGHLPGEILDRKYTSYPLHLDVFRVRDNSIVPVEVKQFGFHRDNMWTDGDGRLTGFSRCSEDGFTKLRVLTGGNHPWRNDPSRIAISVKVNGETTRGEWVSPVEYVAKFSESIACVSDVQIFSSTFVPKKLGINADGRRLGIDVLRLRPEE